MIGPHRTDVDGLDTTHTTIILELHTREETQGIGYTHRVEPLQFITCHHLCRNHTRSIITHYDNFLNSMNTIQTTYMLLLRI